MAEAQPPSNECATCQTKTSLIITCKSGQHTFCQHCVTICLESRTTVENAQAGLLQVKTELIHCPLVEACWSQLESCLVHDIVDHITETRKENIARKLRRTNSVIPCPNENCTFAFYQPEENSFPNPLHIVSEMSSRILPYVQKPSQPSRLF
ncbi:hypothetical protein OS493_010468 [Desmophyllum pertusum]|uniref:Uncharacterized protein n=1 Tax=Desmophyllum pertusum TaxID=174260 RepID=A0A9X0A4U1_9CNID|nr:hypothetical protein OS493_010468 [Desmophyllum pertusum]